GLSICRRLRRKRLLRYAPQAFPPLSPLNEFLCHLGTYKEHAGSDGCSGWYHGPATISFQDGLGEAEGLSICRRPRRKRLLRYATSAERRVGPLNEFLCHLGTYKEHAGSDGCSVWYHGPATLSFQDG